MRVAGRPAPRRTAVSLSAPLRWNGRGNQTTPIGRFNGWLLSSSPGRGQVRRPARGSPETSACHAISPPWASRWPSQNTKATTAGPGPTNASRRLTGTRATAGRRAVHETRCRPPSGRERTRPGRRVRRAWPASPGGTGPQAMPGGPAWPGDPSGWPRSRRPPSRRPSARRRRAWARVRPDGRSTACRHRRR